MESAVISVRVPWRLKEELKTCIGRIKGDLAIPFIRVDRNAH